MTGSHRLGVIPFTLVPSNSLPTVRDPVHTGLITSTLTVRFLARERAVAEIVAPIGEFHRRSDQLILRRFSGFAARNDLGRQGESISSGSIAAGCLRSAHSTKPRPLCRASVFDSPKANP